MPDERPAGLDAARAVLIRGRGQNFARVLLLSTYLPKVLETPLDI